VEEQRQRAGKKLEHIQYLELASRDSVIIGNYNQLDMIDLDGLANGFVDTFHYWSLSLPTPIMDLRVNTKSS
jgi:hypothetical protein